MLPSYYTPAVRAYGFITRQLGQRALARMMLALASVIFIPFILDRNWASRDFWTLLANVLPWVVTFLLLLGASRRPVCAALLTWLFALTVYTVHELKLRELGLPLVPSDLMMVGQLFSSPELYWRYLGAPAIWPLLLAAMVVWAWRERPVFGSKRQATLVLLASVMFTSALLRWQPWPWIYDQAKLDISFWNPAEGAQRSGVVAHFMLLQQNTRSELPRADAAELTSFTAAISSAGDEVGTAAPPGTGVDLIVLQSESFFDPGDLEDIDAAALIPNLLALMQQHPHGRMTVPTFGGLTSRTEFEFLTGFPLAHAPAVQYPFGGLVHRPFYSLAWALRDLGYQTRALHPYDPNFYGRKRVYPLLGFDAFHSVGEFEIGDYHGYYVSDDAMNRRIIEIMGSGQPTFLFAVSIENHGPWDELRSLPEDELSAITLPTSYSERARLPMQQFLAHLRRSDRALGDLARWVQERERPTVLLFYGDHLPNLVDSYAEWSFRNGRPPNEQTVPWLLLDNRIAKPSPERIDLSSAQLAGLFLDRAGLANLPLFDEIERLRQGLPNVTAEQQERWHLHLAANRLAMAPDHRDWHLRDGALAELLKWGPQGREQDRQPEEPMAIFVDLQTPISSEVVLVVNDSRMQIVEREPLHLVGILDMPSTQALLATPGTHPVYLVEPSLRRRQHLGDLTIRPRGTRVGGVFGIGAGPFCAVSNWGPRRTARNRIENRQADGSMGLWAESECFPPGTRFRVDAEPLLTAVNDTIATATLAAERLAMAHGPVVSLMAPSGETLVLGAILVDTELGEGSP
jgi:phosphoglycerol transferase MdoB-like AlkP superfamily enzyme